MRAISLHHDVIVVTSRLLQTNCTIVRGAVSAERFSDEDASAPGETFVVDSPILPDELALLPSLLEQARLPPPGGLLATHADWDHLLGRIAFPDAALGCAESSAVRLQSGPGRAQRELRDFDERLYIVRDRPLQLGSVQALPAPGSCAIGDAELELYPAEGHTPDGMAIWVPWAKVLLAGDYLSSIEIPTVNAREGIDSYLATLERLRPLVARAEHVVPGHGPVLDAPRALTVLAEDAAYLQALLEDGSAAELPRGRRSRAQRELHAANLSAP
ncbi:MAG TPA: MBL fold metallo-hydrolase [Solirubrobacteraceae bacterium]|nr:MBL fold metallo-hydrolase [Solirubrobacteraceae bacterium]